MSNVNMHSGTEVFFWSLICSYFRARVVLNWFLGVYISLNSSGSFWYQVSAIAASDQATYSVFVELYEILIYPWRLACTVLSAYGIIIVDLHLRLRPMFELLILYAEIVGWLIFCDGENVFDIFAVFCRCVNTIFVAIINNLDDFSIRDASLFTATNRFCRISSDI